MASLSSLKAKRVLKDVQTILPKDKSLQDPKALAALTLAVDALGAQVVLDCAHIFHSFDSDMDGQMSVSEVLAMKSSLLAVLPQHAPRDLLPEPGKQLSFVEWASRCTPPAADAAVESLAVSLAAKYCDEVNDGHVNLLDFKRLMADFDASNPTREPSSPASVLVQLIGLLERVRSTRVADTLVVQGVATHSHAHTVSTLLLALLALMLQPLAT